MKIFLAISKIHFFCRQAAPAVAWKWRSQNPQWNLSKNWNFFNCQPTTFGRHSNYKWTIFCQVSFATTWSIITNLTNLSRVWMSFRRNTSFSDAIVFEINGCKIWKSWTRSESWDALSEKKLRERAFEEYTGVTQCLLQKVRLVILHYFFNHT